MTAPIYVPGRRIICAAGAIAPEFHVRGWCPPEPEHTWIDGAEGELAFAMRRPAADCVFTADVMPFTPGGRQSLEVYFNGFRVGYHELGRPCAIEVALPAEMFILRVAHLVLHCRTAVVGTTVGVDDHRRLGIALRSWMIS